MKRIMPLAAALLLAATTLAGCAGGFNLFQPTATPTLPAPTQTPEPPPTATPMPTATPTATPIPPPEVISAGNVASLSFTHVYGVGGLVRMKVSPDGGKLLMGYTTRLALYTLPGFDLLWQVDPGVSLKDVTFSQDGTQIVAIGEGGSVKFWDSASGSLTGEPVKQRPGLTHFALSPGGNWLALTGSDNVTRVYFAASGEVKAYNNGQSYPGGISGLLLAPGETTLAIAGFDSIPRNVMQEWRLNDRAFKVGLVDMPPQMTNWKYSADAKRLYGLTTRSLTAEPSTELIAWSTVTGKIETVFPKDDLIADYLPSPDGKSVLISTREGVLKLIDARNGAFLGEFTRHEAAVNGMAFTPDSAAVISASIDGKVSMWDTYSQKALQDMEATPVTSFVAPAFAALAEKAAVLSPDRRSIVLVNTLNWTPEGHLGQGGNFTYSALAVSTSGAYAAAVDDANHVHVWNTSNGEEMLVTNIRTRYPITRIQFSPNEKFITSLSQGQVLTWEIASGNRLQDLPGVNDFAFSKDNTFIAAGGEYFNLYLTDLATGVMKSDIDADDVYSLAFSPDGNIIAVGARRQWPQKPEEINYIWLYDLRNKKRAPMKFENIPGTVNSLAFDPTGELLASADSQGNLIVWNLRDGSALIQFNEIAASPASLKFSQDGALLFVGGGDGTISMISTSPEYLRQ